jgi:transposase
MPKIITFEDTETRLNDVKRAMRETDDKRLYERYLCISLLLSGYSRKNISEITDRGLDTIGNYIQDYCTSGLEGLSMEYSPGRPTLLTPEQEKMLYDTLVEKNRLTLVSLQK